MKKKRILQLAVTPFVGLIEFIFVWLVLIRWFGFGILATIPLYWWGRIKSKIRGGH